MYERILQKALRTPWAITPQYAAIVQDILRFRASGGRLSEDAIVARIEAFTGEKMAAARQAPTPGGTIAVIPVYGVIAHRAFDASSGATSTEYVGAQLKRVMADPSIGTVVFDFSSPGGTIEGVPELAALIAAARKSKYIVAASNAMMASAAYWLGSQANEIVVTPSGCVGSIGVFTLTEDWSENLKQSGVKIEAIFAGEYKLEGAWWEPLSDEARAYLQASVDQAYTDFVSAVAKGRSTTATNVKANYGKGRVLDAAAALAAGMVDRVETFDATIARLQKAGSAGSTGRAAARVVATAETEGPDPSVCTACNGAGLKPERFMSDPQGQEACDVCGGTGQSSAEASSTSDQADADRDALALARALMDVG
jgi:signal peptide peptidase SppA